MSKVPEGGPSGSLNFSPLPPASHEFRTTEQLPAYSETASASDQNANGSSFDPALAKPNITTSFSTLVLSNSACDPTPQTCLAHLKLLFAIQALKTDVGYTDGLFGLFDSRAEEASREQLSRIREKRWAIYLARAVDRYEAWWMTGLSKKYLTIDGLGSDDVDFGGFVTGKEKDEMKWDEEMLVPLDVLMVWHTHMLNPRAYLEDCIRYGHRALWLAGIPWHLVNSVIDNDDFSYNPSDEAKARWIDRTELQWDNADDPASKAMRCPNCLNVLYVPWTTCNMSEGEGQKQAWGLDLIGHGYGDGGFRASCTQDDCRLRLDRNLLSVSKFVGDAKNLLHLARPMPGTLLDLVLGRPIPSKLPTPLGFPNRMIQRRLRSEVLELVKPRGVLGAQMKDVKDMIEALIKDREAVSEIEGRVGAAAKITNLRKELSPFARMAVRKMMSRYWENFSPFALDLVAAVLRQGVFIDKMYKIDWLHSPAATQTMSRLIEKYHRFVRIMGANKDKLAVPTLDIDLAWHTAQLSPKTYYAFTLMKCNGKFVDHDDKIPEETLEDGFSWTSKAYQDMFGEVYSECTCWYCETVRSGISSSVGRVFGISKHEKIADAFYTSGAARLCPPEKSAHISSHNSIKMMVANQAQTVFSKRLDTQYEKACRRAERKGRKIPSRQDYYDHWGHSYFLYGPFVYPMYFYPGMYYAGDPGYIGGVHGTYGGCVAATCSHGVAGGACGGPGGCGHYEGGACQAGGADGGGGCGGGGGGCGGGGCGGGGGGGGCGG